MIVGVKENIWFLDCLKQFISELILIKKTLKGIKILFFKIYVFIYTSEHLNLGTVITSPNRAFRYKNFPELPPDV